MIALSSVSATTSPPPRPRRSWAPLLAALGGWAALGCTATPTPLAPGLGGSVGVPHHGVLTVAAPLPKKGAGFERLRDNGVHWGNPRLVEAIEAAAARVAAERPGGAPLVVGDLSAPPRGEASGHRSHRTGRDADLLLYATTPHGRSVPSPGFVRFGADGLAPTGDGHYVRLDVDREWRLVRALLEEPRAQVQWLFLARWLEPLVIERAFARGEDPELVWYAESVMLQPGDSSSHDDHLHLRIACSPEEAVGGCEGGGPRWPWLAALPDLSPEPDAELARALLDELTPGAGSMATAK